MRLLHNLLLAALLLPVSAFAHTTPADQERQDFIEQYATLAVEEMNRSRIPASITLAQAILESNWGRGYTVAEANNYFCIKCHNGWTGETYYLMDDEESESCFRVYESPEQSFADHTEFLATNRRYRPLFDLSSTDYINWAKGLKSCGYATDSLYAEKLIALIESHGLYLYDHAVAATSFDLLMTAEEEAYFEESTMEEEEGDWKTQDSDEGGWVPEFRDEPFMEAIESQAIEEEETEDVLEAPGYHLNGAIPQPSKLSSEAAPTPKGRVRLVEPVQEHSFMIDD